MNSKAEPLNLLFLYLSHIPQNAVMAAIKSEQSDFGLAQKYIELLYTVNTLDDLLKIDHSYANNLFNIFDYLEQKTYTIIDDLRRLDWTTDFLEKQHSLDWSIASFLCMLNLRARGIGVYYLDGVGTFMIGMSLFSYGITPYPAKYLLDYINWLTSTTKDLDDDYAVLNIQIITALVGNMLATDASIRCRKLWVQLKNENPSIDPWLDQIEYGIWRQIIETYPKSVLMKNIMCENFTLW